LNQVVSRWISEIIPIHGSGQFEPVASLAMPRFWQHMKKLVLLSVGACVNVARGGS
jgi:hypothetical protein